MKTKLSKIVCGLALLGAALNALGQSTLLAGWNQYNASSQTFPYAASTIDASVSSASMSYMGLVSINDGRGIWSSANHSATLDTATAPYLQWIVNLAPAETVSGATFFVNLARLFSSANLELRSSLDNYATSLGDLSSVNGSYQNYMVPLGQTLTDSTTFRLYVYNVPATVWIYNVGSQSIDTTIGGTFDANMNLKSAGLLGVVAVPEPSTLALAGLGGMGMLLKLRRRK